jgi:hypothetical protein
MLDTVSGRAYLPIIVWSRRFTTRYSTLAKSTLETHGQYHLWQRQPGKDNRARDAARYQDQSRRLWPREGCRSRLADRLAHWPAAQSGSGSERCSKDSQNSGLFSHGAPRRGRAKPSFIPMTTCRVFAARRQRASVGLHPRRWPVIGSTARAGWNVAGRSRCTMYRSTISMSMSNARQAAFPDGRRSDRPTWRWSAEQGTTLAVGKVPACLIVFRKSRWPLACLRWFWSRCSSVSPSLSQFIRGRNEGERTVHRPRGAARLLAAIE